MNDDTLPGKLKLPDEALENIAGGVTHLWGTDNKGNYQYLGHVQDGASPTWKLFGPERTAKDGTLTRDLIGEGAGSMPTQGK